MSKQIVVLGSGISGLSTAWFLRRALIQMGKPAVITIIEKQNQIGGWFNTVPRHDPNGKGFLLERGPHSFRPRGPSAPYALRLVQDLELHDKVIGTSSTSTARYLWTSDHGIEKLPNSLVEVFTSRVTYMLPFLGLREIFIPPKTNGDESVHDFFTRRFNESVADNLASAMVAGIYAGDAKQLSIKSCFPVLVDLEQKHGSIVKGILMEAMFPDTLKTETDDNSITSISLDPDISKLSKSSGVSFRDGMQTLVNTLKSKLTEQETDSNVTVNFLLDTEINRIEQNGSIVTKDNMTIESDHIFSTIPAKPLQNILLNSIGAKTIPCFNTLVDELPTVDVNVINLGYTNPSNKFPLDGFGHLIPAKHQNGILGVIYDSSVFPDQKPDFTKQSDSTFWFTIMAGGAHFPEINSMNEDQVLEFAIDKVQDQLGVDLSNPDVAIAILHKNCIPQYGIGHDERVSNTMEELSTLYPNLTVLGNNFRGVGIADCVANGGKAAFSYIKTLQT